VSHSDQAALPALAAPRGNYRGPGASRPGRRRGASSTIASPFAACSVTTRTDVLEHVAFPTAHAAIVAADTDSRASASVLLRRADAHIRAHPMRFRRFQAFHSFRSSHPLTRAFGGSAGQGICCRTVRTWLAAKSVQASAAGMTASGSRCSRDVGDAESRSRDPARCACQSPLRGSIPVGEDVRVDARGYGRAGLEWPSPSAHPPCVAPHLDPEDAARRDPRPPPPIRPPDRRPRGRVPGAARPRPTVPPPTAPPITPARRG
jgi:hypothetical protein